MFRRFCSILGILSLLFSLGFCALWAHSYVYWDILEYGAYTHPWGNAGWNSLVLFRGKMYVMKDGLLRSPDCRDGFLDLESGSHLPTGEELISDAQRAAIREKSLHWEINRKVIHPSAAEVAAGLTDSEADNTDPEGVSASVEDWGYSCLGFSAVLASPTRVSTLYRIAVPLWALAILFASPTMVSLCRRRRLRNRRQAHRCLHCGYDLQVHSSGEKCPECGAEIALTGHTIA